MALICVLLFVLAVGVVSILVSITATGMHFVPPPHYFAVRRVAFGLLIVLAVGLLIAGRAFRRFAAPLGDVMEAAGAVADGNYGVRVVERGHPDVRRLAQAFNEMASRLQAHEATRRGLLADLAHELKTPLAVVQGTLEGLLDGVYPRDDAQLAALLEETRVLSTLIEDLRTLALAETGALALHRESVDPCVLLHDVVTAFQPKGTTAGITLTTACAPSVPSVEIDPVRIRQVLANLLTNAIQHTPPGGSVHVACAEALAPGEVAFSVADTGVGIAPEDLPHVFDRFYKSKDSRGSGLGLAIAKQLVVAHGGTIELTSEPGQGTTVRFTLGAIGPRG
jgi:signal transduction histidine kinase